MTAEARPAGGIQSFRPVPWELIPDLGLYMDQVVTFIGRSYAPLFGGDVRRFLTPAMINNYVKARLIPRPTGKKYGRDQLALLMMIVTLKQVVSLDAIAQMLALKEGDSVEPLYNEFCTRLSDSLRGIQGDVQEQPPLVTAMDYAILASACSAACAAMLAADGQGGEIPGE